ncbi:MAG TPA: phosphatase PAP2 family protein [Candidatus Saccharimonadaceae bacterium]|nr:phosphatase PAP2 family protein [Candidatus Saccharimonadaceae bacterium]
MSGARWWLIAVLPMLAPVDSLDHVVARAVQGARAPAWEGVMHEATQLPTGWRLAVGVGALLVIDRGAGLATVATAAVGAIPANLAVEGLKRAVDRRRPDGSGHGGGSSFPSSHAANAWLLAVVLARRWPRGAPLWAASAALVAFSRMYLHRHYLSDVAVGSAIGLASGWFAVATAGRRWMPGKAPAPAPTSEVEPGDTLC